VADKTKKPNQVDRTFNDLAGNLESKLADIFKPLDSLKKGLETVEYKRLENQIEEKLREISKLRPMAALTQSGLITRAGQSNTELPLRELLTQGLGLQEGSKSYRNVKREFRINRDKFITQASASLLSLIGSESSSVDALRAQKLELEELHGTQALASSQRRAEHYARPGYLVKGARDRANDPSVLAGIMRTPKSDLALRRELESFSGQWGEHAAELQEAAKDINTPEGRARYTALFGRGEKIRERYAIASGALAQSHRKGLDLAGDLAYSEELRGAIGKREWSQEVRHGAKTGKYGTLEEEERKLQKLGDSFKDLSLRVEEAAAAIKDVTGAAREEAENKLDASREELRRTGRSYEQQRAVVRAVENDGSGGNRRRDMRLQRAQALLGASGNVLDAVQDITVSQIGRERMAKAGIADIVNSQHSDALAAAHGDSAAIFRLAAQKSAVDSANSRGGISTGVGYGKTIVNTGLSLVSGLSAGLVTGSPTIAAATAIGGLAGAASEGIAAYRGIPGMEARASDYASSVRLTDAQMKIMSRAMDIYKDSAHQIRANTIGAGVGATSDIINQFLGSEKPSGALGFFTTSQRSEMIGNLVNSSGRNFTGLSAGSRDAVMSRMATAQNLGVIGTGQYASLFGQVSGVAGGERGGSAMADILADAVRRGVDSAKGITNMVSLLTQSASAEASKGIDIMGGARDTLLRGVNSLAAAPISEEMRQQRSAVAADLLKRQTGTRDLSLNTIMQKNALEKAIPGIDVVSSANVVSRDVDFFRDIQERLTKGDTAGFVDQVSRGFMAPVFLDKGGKIRDDASERLSAILKEVKEPSVTRGPNYFIQDKDRKTFEALPSMDQTERQKAIEGFTDPAAIALARGLESSGYLGAAGPKEQVQYGGSSIDPSLTGRAAGILKQEEAASISDYESWTTGRRGVGVIGGLGTVELEAAKSQNTMADVLRAKQDSEAGEVSGGQFNVADFNNSVLNFGTAVNLLLNGIKNTGSAPSVPGPASRPPLPADSNQKIQESTPSGWMDNRSGWREG
jgi:hypothetical protein